MPISQSSKHRIGRIAARPALVNIGAVLFLIFLIAAAGIWLVVMPRETTGKKDMKSGLQLSQKTEKLFPVIVRKPEGPPRVLTGIEDIHGQPVTVACSTCHETRKPNFTNKSVTDLNEFHGSLELSHGTVSCLSCHNSNDYDALKLADGTRVEFTDVMTLCAQCHGPQMRAYEHGAHGGFNGHWDLTRGPQEKNNCVDCHNPHSPKFPKMQPTFKPRDRFLNSDNHEKPKHD